MQPFLLKIEKASKITVPKKLGLILRLWPCVVLHICRTTTPKRAICAAKEKNPAQNKTGNQREQQDWCVENTHAVVHRVILKKTAIYVTALMLPSMMDRQS